MVPEVNQWLHVFRWHGSKDASDQYTKVPGELVFTKLRTIPDQFYYNAVVSEWVGRIVAGRKAVSKSAVPCSSYLLGARQIQNPSDAPPTGNFLPCSSR